MKSHGVVAAGMTALLALGAAGCKGPSTPTPPDDSVEITLSVIAHTAPSASEGRVPVEITITAVAANPGLVGGFFDEDTGQTTPYPAVLHETTPWAAPIYFPPGSIIAFSLTARAWGMHLYEGLECAFDDVAGNILSHGVNSAEPFSTGGTAEVVVSCLYATS